MLVGLADTRLNLHYLELAKALNPSGASAELVSSEVAGYQRTKALCVRFSISRFTERHQSD